MRWGWEWVGVHPHPNLLPWSWKGLRAVGSKQGKHGLYRFHPDHAPPTGPQWLIFKRPLKRLVQIVKPALAKEAPHPASPQPIKKKVGYGGYGCFPQSTSHCGRESLPIAIFGRQFRQRPPPILRPTTADSCGVCCWPSQWPTGGGGAAVGQFWPGVEMDSRFRGYDGWEWGRPRCSRLRGTSRYAATGWVVKWG